MATVDPSTSTFRCPICVQQASSLQEHIRECHPDVECLQCGYCQLLCRSQGIDMHLQLHVNRRAFSAYMCPTCHEQQSSFRALLTHARNQMTCARAIFQKCFHCQKPFSNLPGLFSHARETKFDTYTCAVADCPIQSSTFEEVLEHCIEKHEQDAESVRFNNDVSSSNCQIKFGFLVYLCMAKSFAPSC